MYLHAYVHVYVVMCVSPTLDASNPLSSILHDVHQQLSADLAGKATALEIDTQCSELGNTSDTIQFHTDPTRIKKGYLPPQTCTTTQILTVCAMYVHVHVVSAYSLWNFCGYSRNLQCTRVMRNGSNSTHIRL